MAVNRTPIYFFNRISNREVKYVIHTMECPYLPEEFARVYIGIAPSSTHALCRAEKIFPKKSFVLCPKCCREDDFEP
ncbi:hypothetical protein IGI39_004034 [Enterococcus sp. AZ135]|uniref:hypothetical protein n=1 Tax=unclassified Enterococcus TaxID=2608891 RepID=UPI003F275323